MQNEYYELTLYGSRVRKFIKYLKKLFPEYICIIHNVDSLSDKSINIYYRYCKYSTHEKYSVDKLRDHFRRNPCACFYIPADINCNLFTLFKLQSGQSDVYTQELLTFFNKIQDVSIDRYKQKCWNVYICIRYKNLSLYGLRPENLEGNIEYSSSIIYNNFLYYRK